MENKIALQELLQQLEVKHLSPEQVTNILKLADYSGAFCSLTCSLKTFLRTEFKEQFPYSECIEDSIIELEDHAFAVLDAISGISNDSIINKYLFNDHVSTN